MHIKNRDELVSHGDWEGKSLALDILEGGLATADPYENTLKLIQIEGDRLLVGGQPRMNVSGYGDEEIDLSAVKNIYVVGAGKAVQRQAQALEDLLGPRLTDGAINVKKGEGCKLKRIQVTEAAHPVPDESSVAGAERIMQILRSAGPDDLVFTVFSDGASSLFTVPGPGLTLEDVRRIFFLAIKYGRQGLIIQVQPYFSAVSGGRVLPAIYPARAVNLIMQVGIYPRWRGQLPMNNSFVPSWPPAPRRMAQARQEIMRLPWWEEFTPAFRRLIQDCDPNNDVPGREFLSDMKYSYWQPIDLYQMVEGARSTAERLGLKAITLCGDLHAYSSAAATVVGNIAKNIEMMGEPVEPPVAILTGGHLDVPTGDSTGIGGRNQEFSLVMAQLLGEGSKASQNIVVAAMDSDGTDGPGTQHRDGEKDPLCMAGGVVDGNTLNECRQLGINVAAELANHNSTMALMATNSAIYTGNTGMCLGDLRVVLVRRRTPVF